MVGGLEGGGNGSFSPLKIIRGYSVAAEPLRKIQEIHGFPSFSKRTFVKKIHDPP